MEVEKKDKKFSAAERYAVYVTYNAQCYLCMKPIHLRDMEIDHILPESLLDNIELLNYTKNYLKLQPSFKIQSFENWLPSCRNCNREKRNQIFQPSPLFEFVLNRASNGVVEATKLCQRVKAQPRIGDAIGRLETAAESGSLSDDDLAMLAGVIEVSRQKKAVFITPLVQILSHINGDIVIARGRYGIGRTSRVADYKSGWLCSCGQAGPWDGARCLSCGYLSED